MSVRIVTVYWCLLSGYISNVQSCSNILPCIPDGNKYLPISNSRVVFCTLNISILTDNYVKCISSVHSVFFFLLFTIFRQVLRISKISGVLLLYFYVFLFLIILTHILTHSKGNTHMAIISF